MCKLQQAVTWATRTLGHHSEGRAPSLDLVAWGRPSFASVGLGFRRSSRVCDARRVHDHRDAPRPALPLTGARTLPGVPRENYWYRRHEAAYRAFLPYCHDADVLDPGSG